jgi:hypothetical protein
MRIVGRGAKLLLEPLASLVGVAARVGPVALERKGLGQTEPPSPPVVVERRGRQLHEQPALPLVKEPDQVLIVHVVPRGLPAYRLVA